MIAQLDSLYLKMRPWKLWSRLVSYGLFEGRPLTTRGRWINPLVFAHFAVEKYLPQFSYVERPVFILGTGRSGTTVLGIVLSMHREVGFLNEPKALWHAIYPEEDLIGSYSRGAARYRLAASDATPKCISNARRIFGAYQSITFSQRIVDKYPELIFRVPFVKAIFPDAKFLFLVRNGWDTCRSIEGWSNRLGQQVSEETHNWWGVNNRKWIFLVEQLVPGHPDLAPHAEVMLGWTNQTDMAALEWIVTMREGLILLEQFPDDVMRVNYESLCTNSSRDVMEIAKFMEVDVFDEVFTEYANKTLQLTRSNRSFKLNMLIETPFMEMMNKLGYEVAL